MGTLSTFPGEISADAAVRMAAESSLVTFAEAMNPAYKAAEVHKLIASKLEDCFAKKIKRICISMPPRTGKSELCSILFPAWALTKNPKLEIITASYSSELSEAFSQKCKGVLTSREYLQLFPEIIHPDANRQRSWGTLAGGRFFSTGVGGGCTGLGADLLLIDDAVKSRAEADSESMRELLWGWFVSTAMTRLSPDGVAIVIGTRWNRDDLIGRLTSPDYQRELEDLGCGDSKWEILNLEAVCENPETDPLHRKAGAALWPEKWPIPLLLLAKASLGSREFSALYQGQPTAAGGNACDVSKLQYVEAADVPKDLRTVRAWDLALGTAMHHDWSVGAKVGVDHKTGLTWVLNIHRGRRRWPEQKALILALAEAEQNPLIPGSDIPGAPQAQPEVWKIAVESVAAFSVCYEELKTALLGKVKVEGVTPSDSKEIRAQPFLNQIDAGKVFLVRGAWNADFISELEGFPAGAHDDQIDAAAAAYTLASKKPDRLLIA
jgi:predicted phage terminase large subunit-like protein